MAKYTDSKCRLCRREGVKLFLKGERCYKSVCALEKRPTVPGQHGSSRKKVSEYGLQLREKQKCKRIYGVLEGQFKKYYLRADRMKGITGENMLSLLERRLDNVIYRMGIGSSRAEARQLVTHGHFSVNGRPCNIASYIVKVGAMPKWLEFNPESLTGKILALPQRDDIDAQIAEHLIVELYSK